MLCNCGQCQFDWSIVTPIVAIMISIAALLVNRWIALKNRNLSILQSIFKITMEKANECNVIWDGESTKDANPNSPHFKVMSELTISREVIEKSISLFARDSGYVKNQTDDFFFIFWKQLRPDLRDWVRRAPRVAEELKNEYYAEQVLDFQKKFEKHFEPNK